MIFNYMLTKSWKRIDFNPNKISLYKKRIKNDLLKIKRYNYNILF